MNQTFSTAEAAAYLGLSRAMVYQHNHYQTGPKASKVKGRLVYTQADLDEWKKNRAAGNKPKRQKRSKSH